MVARPEAEGSWIEARLHEAMEMVRGGRPEQARPLLHRILTEAPSHSRTLNLLGLCAFKEGRFEIAERIYERLVLRYPRSVSLRVNLGLVALRRGRSDDAVAHLERAVALAPEHKRARCYLGLALYRRGDLALAREHFMAGGALEFAARVEKRFAEESRRSASSPRAGLMAPLPIPEAVEDTRFQQATGSAELGAAREAAERVGGGAVPRRGVERFGGGPVGFSAGPGSRARLRAEEPSFVRREDVVAVVGEERALEGVRGPFVAVARGAVLLLTTPRTAVAVEEVADVEIRDEALRGFCGDWRVRPRPTSGGFWFLEGRGDLLLDAHGETLVVGLQPQEHLAVTDAALVGGASGCFGAVDPDGFRACTGPGWVLLAPWRGVA